MYPSSRRPWPGRRRAIGASAGALGRLEALAGRLALRGPGWDHSCGSEALSLSLAPEPPASSDSSSAAASSSSSSPSGCPLPDRASRSCWPAKRRIGEVARERVEDAGAHRRVLHAEVVAVQ